MTQALSRPKQSTSSQTACCSRSAAKPALASIIEIRLSEAAKEDLIQLSTHPDVISNTRLKLTLLAPPCELVIHSCHS